MRRFLCCLLVLRASAATWTIDPGSSRFGNAIYTQSGPVTVTTAGAPASVQRGFAYFDHAGLLKISLPPGVTGTCTGAPCDIFTVDAVGASYWASGAHQFATNASPAQYYIDPIYNTTSSTVGSYSLFANAPAPSVNEPTTTGAFELALKFTVSTSGFIVGLRFYRIATDATTTQIGTLYSNTGTSLASKAFAPSGFGWQTMYFTSAVAVTAGTFYRASLHTDAYAVQRDKYFQNYREVNGALVSAAAFGDSGPCDPTASGNWPMTPDGYTNSNTTILPSAGILACITYSVAGAATIVSPDFGGGPGNLGATRWAGGHQEGSQVMIGAYGPGPYALINTVIDNSGNQWHHSNEGGYRSKTDYWYYRNVWQWQPSFRTGATGSDGWQYISRQLLEWKAGFRIRLEGNIFQYAWNDGQGSALTIVVGNKDAGAHDIWIGNNEFRHGPGVMQGFSQYEEGPPPARDYFGNNLIWGMGSYASSAQTTPGRGWLLEGAGAFEDARVEHNTVMPAYGQYPAWWYIFQRNNPEGVSITDNILPIDSFTAGIPQESNWCVGVPFGEATILNVNCGNFRALTFSKNLLYPAVYSVSDTITGGGPYTFTSNQTQAGITGSYPTTSAANYLPSSTTPSTYGWFVPQAYPATVSSFNASLVDARVRSGSLLSPGNGAYKATDGGNIGADLQKIRDAEGVVELVGVPASLLSATGATVVFNAPDAQACPVDWKVFDGADPYTTSGFTRAADNRTGRTRNVGITGLTTKTTYQYVVRCAAWQPNGLFITK